MADVLSGWQRRVFQGLEGLPHGQGSAVEVARRMGIPMTATGRDAVGKTLRRMYAAGLGYLIRQEPADARSPAIWVLAAKGRRALAEMEQSDAETYARVDA